MWKEGILPLNQPNSDVHRPVETVKEICGKCVRQKKTTTLPHTDVCGYVEKRIFLYYVPGEIFFLIVLTFCLVSSEVCISFCIFR